MALEGVIRELSFQTTGKIEGDNRKAGQEKTIQFWGYYGELQMPKDPRTGQPNGHRVHKAHRFVIPFGVHTPLLLQGAARNENITTLIAEFYTHQVDGDRASADGQAKNFMTITYKNAQIASVMTKMPNARLNHELDDVEPYQEFELVFEEITVEHKIAGRMFTDSWLDANS